MVDAAVSIYKPGHSFSSRPKKEKSMKEVSMTEFLDLKKTCDQLYKEIERKETRNLALLKELQGLRGNFALQQVAFLISKFYRANYLWNLEGIENR